jgi:hypothetical protein
VRPVWLVRAIGRELAAPSRLERRAPPGPDTTKAEPLPSRSPSSGADGDPMDLTDSDRRPSAPVRSAQIDGAVCRLWLDGVDQGRRE